ncbi:hypothetical protein JOF56_009902 [Kibdelosporangium banguiense]|uniref:Pentapeptide repeat-containing protein n=1 Tax=Kibdelosporangium banguiense TaxID=1365924 RepID=A0ABS4TYN9_9PSEU|nr:hypothetical protein [Kibdelosporangium banguiense]MBP2329517.1 hypothetical protein [Kibdelosporangium banguiense]
MSGLRLENEDFSNRRLRELVVAAATLVRCDFSRTRVAGGEFGGGFEPSEYVECVFDGCRVKNVLPGRATFIGCSFRDVTIQNLRCHEAQFIDCVFTGLLRTVTFSAVPWSTERLGRTRNAYHGNDFAGARLMDVAFRGGIDLDRQRLPEGPEYVLVRNAPEILPAIREQVRTWPESLRLDAETSLWILENDCETGQRDLLVRRTLLGRTAEGIDKLAALLIRS